MNRVVLAYSGGLDTSVAIPWLSERGYEVIAVAVDVGQPGDLNAAVDRATQLGAVEAHLIDAKEAFAARFVLPALQMNALYQGRYPLVSALSRPLIAELLVDIARRSGAEAVAHGCTGKGNDQVRFEVSLGALAPDIEVLAPVREWGMTRGDAIEYARVRKLPITTTKSSPYSIDENLWGRSIECGVLEDAWQPPPEDVFELTSSPRDVASEPSEIEIGFDSGVPVEINGETLDLLGVADVVGKIAGSFGIGRIDMIEDRLVGIKSREVYEAPAALTLIAAHQDLESLTLERMVAREKRRIDALWADVVYEGMWFSPLREALDAFAATTQKHVTGHVKLRLAAGSCLPIARRAPAALYDRALATYEEGDTFDQGDAAGFVRMWGLPLKQVARIQGR